MYVSYSWDDKGNKERVKKLVLSLNDLLKNEYSIIFDQDIFNKQTQDVNRFIVDNIVEADIVIIFVTPSYVIKADRHDDGYGNQNNKRSGVEIETSYILDRKHQKKKSIITVLLDGDNLPKYIKELSFIREKTDEDITETLSKRIKSFVKERESVCIDINNEKLKVIDESDIENIDIEFSYENEPARLCGALWLSNNYFTLEHYQIMHLFKKIASEDATSNLDNKKVYSFYCNYFNIEFKTYDLYENFITKIHNAMCTYLESISDFEAKYEIYSRYPMNNNYEFKLATVDKNIWIEMLRFANSFDWDNGKSEWNIFQRNDYYMHIFSPGISYNTKYDPCEHTILYGINKEDFHSNDVDIYVKVKDIVYNSKTNKIDKRKTWSVDMTYKWFKKEFVPFFCKNKKYSKDIIYFEDSYIQKEDIFSQAQMFYMSNRAGVNKNELKQLREVLIFCLNKRSSGGDLGYIINKLGIRENLKTDDEIIQYLESDKFNKNLMESNYNSSIADDILRCIRSFTDDFSTHKINENDLEYLTKKIHSLVEKMNIVNLLDKYQH
ncbi:hypothetical protein FDF26_09005 [Clostridium botulinum]|nr:hypothetical protein [Clostridium botulinum]